MIARRLAARDHGAPTPTTGATAPMWQRVWAMWVSWSLIAALSIMYISPHALPLSLIGLTVAISIFIMRTWRPGNNWRRSAAVTLPAISLSGLLLATNEPGVRVDLVFIGTAIAWVGLLVGRWDRRWQLCIVSTSATLMVLAGWNWGHAPIDVFQVMQGGGSALLHGANPYFQRFGSTTAGVPFYYYPYGPIALLVSLPFAGLGDVRILSVIAALVILSTVFTRKLPLLDLTQRLTLLLLSPWLVWSVLHSWNELPISALLLWWFILPRSQLPSTWPLVGLALGISPVAIIPLVPIAILYPELRRDIFFGCGLGAGIYLITVAAIGLPQGLAIWHLLSGAKYGITWSVGGLYQLFAGTWPPFWVTIVFETAVVGLSFRFAGKLQLHRQLWVGVLMLLIVLCSPASYFEYMIFPAIWIWWYLASVSPELLLVEGGDVATKVGLAAP